MKPLSNDGVFLIATISQRQMRNILPRYTAKYGDISEQEFKTLEIVGQLHQRMAKEQYEATESEMLKLFDAGKTLLRWHAVLSGDLSPSWEPGLEDLKNMFGAKNLPKGTYTQTLMTIASGAV